MTRSARHLFIETHGGLSVMKSILSLFGVAALAVSATPALAQTTTDDANVDVIGNAPPICSLPTTWTAVSWTGGASSGQFTGNTWTIPANVLANPNGNGVVTSTEYAIRIRGEAMCNTSHRITLTSQNGGLVNEAYTGSPPPAPIGFTWKRRMIYNAQWQNDSGPGTGSPVPPAKGIQNWGVINFVPTAAGTSEVYTHDNKAPPGERNFDIRMGVLREATSGPLLAGLYQDVITVTLEPLS